MNEAAHNSGGGERRQEESFVRSAGVISALTLLSRLLGVARDVICAAVFGAGMVWDAFSFAFRVPNLFRRLLGEGALSAAFVPVLSEYLARRPAEEAEQFSGRVAGALLTVLTALTILGEALVLLLMATVDLTGQWRLALLLTAVLLPYMIFICLTALAGAALHCLRHFAAPALAPVVLNACWILAVAAVGPHVSDDPRVRVYVLAGAILAGGVLQLLLQVVVLRARGFRVRLTLRPWHPQVRRVVASMAPVALGMAAFQANAFLDGVIALSLAAPAGRETFRLLGGVFHYPMVLGANSVLYYANRLMQAPLGIFGIALATAVFPTLSRQAARGDHGAFARTVLRGLGLVIFVGLPAGAGLIVLRRPIIALLFQRGAFTAPMAERTAHVLVFYSLGIWAYCALHVLTRAFYGLGCPAVPAKVAAAAVGLNLALNLTLVWPLGAAGLAASTAACAALQVAALTLLLSRRVPLTGIGRLVGATWRTVLAGAVAVGAAWLALQLTPAASRELGVKLVRALAPAAAGGMGYVLAAAALGTEELSLLLSALRR